MPRPIKAIIDTAAMAHNLEIIRTRMQKEAQKDKISILAVIKAHAYGHGIAAAVKGFAKADGLAMIDMEEAAICRQQGWQKPLVLLEGFFDPSDVPLLDKLRLTPILHNVEQVNMLKAYQPAKPIDVFVNLNTGLNRLGFQAENYRDVFQQLQALQATGVIGSIGKMTHFASAEDDPNFTLQQINTFNKLTSDLPGPVSVLNSPATFMPGMADKIPASHYWHRPGICLYGPSPFGVDGDNFGLKPAMTLKGELLNVHTLSQGEGVSYDLLFRAPRDMRIGIVSCGYADGYPRFTTHSAPINVDGVPTRTIGSTAMDMLAVDLDAVPDAKVGSPVILWGKGGPSVDAVAKAAGTIPDTLITRLAARVPKKVI